MTCQFTEQRFQPPPIERRSPAMAGKAGKPPSDFAAQLIAAIEDAQAAASRPLSEPLLAQAAWDKLQYDFPVRGL